MSKRRRSADEEGGPPRHYLYFVVDDWTDGYSIYKVDVADFDGDPSADLDSQTRRLPGPPVFRLECSHSRCRHPRFAALGSRIIAMDYRENKATTRVLMFDTATGGVAVGPCVPAELQRLYRFVPAGDSLYVVGTLTSDDPAYFRFGVLAADAGKGRRWAWNAGLGGPCNMWQVVCTAAHPDGRTIFFSMYYAITYSFDTETREWKHQGDWKLPFQGHACYDGELDAWVGLRRGPDELESGTVCCCDVVPARGGDGQRPPPSWKTVKEKIVCEDRRRTMGTTLARIGRGTYCLVEYRAEKGSGHEESRLFYATAFRLRYDKDGVLD
uniref:Uncharacterized protein n=1 Tax=Hordeum vulgare subsp. vulgare TaxID=112509 RepID=A0A8I6YIH9_HORVV